MQEWFFILNYYLHYIEPTNDIVALIFVLSQLNMNSQRIILLPTYQILPISPIDHYKFELADPTFLDDFVRYTATQTFLLCDVVGILQNMVSVFT